MILKHGFQVAMVVCLSNVGFASAQELGGYEFLSLGGTPHDVVYDANRNLAYVSNRSANQIHVVSLATRQLVQNITVGNMPTGMAITADGNQLLAVYSNDAQMGVIDLNTLITVQTINLPQNNNHVLLRVNVASTGEVLWRDATTSNPYGHIYSLDPDTGISTRLFSTQPVCRYSPSYDGSQFLIMFECDDATVWDAQTQSAPAPQQVPGFSYGNGGWITQGTLRNDGSALIMTRAGEETRFYNSSFTYLGSQGAMGWGTLGPWQNKLLAVRSYGNERTTKKIDLLDVNSRILLDTLELPENIGWGEYDFGNMPLALAYDADSLLLVGQTGLYFVDTSLVPEPATLGLAAFGLLGFLRRKTR